MLSISVDKHPFLLKSPFNQSVIQETNAENERESKEPMSVISEFAKKADDLVEACS